jgi:rRNA maturation RNase YbeY
VQGNSTFHIEIQIDPDFTGQVDEASLHKAAAATLRHESAPAGATVTLIITGDEEEVRQLNQQFRQLDAPTDVLAFPAASDAPFVEAPGQPLYLGDVIVSHPRAAAQAADAGLPVQAELNLLAVHGILHLLGYDHATHQERAAMWAAQEAVLTNGEPRAANPLLRSFRYAFAGLGYTLRTQRNARIHLLATVAVIALGLWLRLDAIRWTVLTLTIALVFFAELVNTVAEAVVDLITDEYHPRAKMVKDVSAGAVLVAALAAVVVGLLILGPPLLAQLGLATAKK